ncbi:MAG TPA: hypothetical protein VIY48_18745 [Candidatus Paceibacterota bacterium]
MDPVKLKATASRLVEQFGADIELIRCSEIGIPDPTKPWRSDKIESVQTVKGAFTRRIEKSPSGTMEEKQVYYIAAKDLTTVPDMNYVIRDKGAIWNIARVVETAVMGQSILYTIEVHQ